MARRPKTLIFVYGSLRRSFEAESILKDLPGAHRRVRAWVRGRLVDLGDYPGAVLDPKSDSKIQGEIWAIDSHPSPFPKLDAYEEFVPASPERSLFVRKRTTVHTRSETLIAWIYVPRVVAATAPVISSGDWATASAR